MLNRLPQEIIDNHLVPVLDAEGIANLSEVVHVTIDKELYDSVFQDNTYFDDYDEVMFRERARARLYVVGESRQFPLMCNNSDKYYETLDEEYVDQLKRIDYQEPTRRMYAPMPLPLQTGGQTIDALSTTANHVTVKNSRGEIRFVSLLPTDMSCLEHKVKAREEKEDTVSDSTGEAQEIHKVSMKYFNMPYKPCNFVKMFPTQSPWAQDDTGLLWCWCDMPTAWHDPAQGVPFLLVDKETNELIKGRVSIMRSGERFSSCMIEGRGIFWWENRDMEKSLKPNGWRSGYPCRNGKFCVLKVTELEASSTEGVLDFVVFSSLIVLLMDDGKVEMRGYEFESMFFCRIVEIEQINDLGPFRQICWATPSTAHMFFALVTEDDRVVVVRVIRKGSFHFEEFVPVELEDVRIASVCVQDAHFLALTYEGEVYSWGNEFFSDGCLGRGRLNDLIDEGGDIDEGYLTVQDPAKMKLPGRAYAITVNALFSTVLVYTEKKAGKKKKKKKKAKKAKKIEPSDEATDLTRSTSVLSLGSLESVD